jgi:tRNA-splicing ligase RtcB
MLNGRAHRFFVHRKGATRAFGSACHGAGRGILVRSPGWRGVAEEAPLAYKDVGEVVDAADRAGLAAKVASLQPLICIKG